MGPLDTVGGQGNLEDVIGDGTRETVGEGGGVSSVLLQPFRTQYIVNSIIIDDIVPLGV